MSRAGWCRDNGRRSASEKASSGACRAARQKEVQERAVALTIVLIHTSPDPGLPSYTHLVLLPAAQGQAHQSPPVHQQHAPLDLVLGEEDLQRIALHRRGGREGGRSPRVALHKGGRQEQNSLMLQSTRKSAFYRQGSAALGRPGRPAAKQCLPIRCPEVPHGRHITSLPPLPRLSHTSLAPRLQPRARSPRAVACAAGQA